MRREQLFNRDGVYSTLVTCNLLMHREATVTGIGILNSLTNDRELNHPIRILDLACGGLPIAISNMMEHFLDGSFTYTGIDINPDQVELASKFFKLSENVFHVDLIEGNAWDLQDLNLRSPFDMIFTGFNLHHGTPEEIDYLMRQVIELLDDRGIFLNHDWYRPDGEVYVRRPSCNPNNPNESYRLVAPELLDKDTLPYAKKTVPYSASDPEWRLKFINDLTEAYRQHQKDAHGAHTLKSHMLARDFPVSREDLTDILQKYGFFFDFIHHHDPNVAVSPFLAMPFACKDAGLFQRVIQSIKFDDAFKGAAVA